MSLQELHVKALEEHIVNLTRDCHYLISLINQTDEIDWDNWPQGQKIKEDLERSKDFFMIQKHKEKSKESSYKSNKIKQHEIEQMTSEKIIDTLMDIFGYHRYNNFIR